MSYEKLEKILYNTLKYNAEINEYSERLQTRYDELLREQVSYFSNIFFIFVIFFMFLSAIFSCNVYNFSTVAHKRNATDYFLTLKAYNLPTTSVKVIILYLF